MQGPIFPKECGDVVLGSVPADPDPRAASSAVPSLAEALHCKETALI